MQTRVRNMGKPSNLRGRSEGSTLFLSKLTGLIAHHLSFRSWLGGQHIERSVESIFASVVYPWAHLVFNLDVINGTKECALE